MKAGPHRRRAAVGRHFAAGAVFALVAAWGCGSTGPASAAPEQALPNVTVMRHLVAGLGKAVIDSSGGLQRDTVFLDVDSSASSWIASTELGALLGSAGRRVVTRGTGAARATRWLVRGLTLAVEYRNIRKPGLFSGALVDRVVTASFSSEITEGDLVLFAGTMTASAADTVEESRIAGLESESLDCTRGQVPDLRSFDRFIEPFVIIGATGAAIFLFFQVRS